MTNPLRTPHRDLVLNAVQQGVSEPKAIAIWLSIPIERVRTELMRLREAGKIQHKGRGYVLASKGCALAEVWTNHAHSSGASSRSRTSR